MTYKELFGNRKPVVAMLHLKGRNEKEILDRAKAETEIYFANGVDAVLVEDYFGSVADAEMVLAWLRDNHSDKIYGVNILDDHRHSFELANRYGAKFIQLDSVCGHLPPRKDVDYARELEELRANSNVVVLGGVRFKYKPVLSGRSLKDDLSLGKDRCDAIVVTGDGTGRKTPIEKVQEFRWHLDKFPLVVGAGCSPDSIAETFSVADGVVVGSYFKHDHKVGGDVRAEHVKEFMSQKEG